MPDNVTAAKRSEIMSRVRSRGNKSTELFLVRLFRKRRIVGWRRHVALPGTPDFVFRPQRLAVFVDGCFWHCCPRHRVEPLGNRIFWQEKFARNRARDLRVNRELRRKGWRVLRIWQHELRRPDRVVEKVLNLLDNT